jgi:hypothetical protein
LDKKNKRRKKECNCWFIQLFSFTFNFDFLLDQLVSYFGEIAKHPIGYLEKNWLDDPISRGGYMGILPPNIMQLAGNNITHHL